MFGDLSQREAPKFFVYSSDTSELSTISFENGQKVFSLTNADINLNWNKQKKGESLINNLIVADNFTESSLFSVLTYIISVQFGFIFVLI